MYVYYNNNTYNILCLDPAISPWWIIIYIIFCVQALQYLPDESTIKAVQKIIWAASSGSMDLLVCATVEMRNAIEEVGVTLIGCCVGLDSILCCTCMLTHSAGWCFGSTVSSTLRHVSEQLSCLIWKLGSRFIVTIPCGKQRFGSKWVYGLVTDVAQ